MFWFGDVGIEIDHVTQLASPGYHTVYFTWRQRSGAGTMYAVDVASGLIGSLHTRDLAKHVFDVVDSGQFVTVIKRFKEMPP